MARGRAAGSGSGTSAAAAWAARLRGAEDRLRAAETALAERSRALDEAREQQTATREILRLISQSSRTTQPVFDTIANAARRLCDATSANVFTYDGTLVHLVALARDAEAVAEKRDWREDVRKHFPRPPGRESAASRAVLTGGVVSIPDTLTDPDYALKDMASIGFRSLLAVPLLREGVPIGAIALGRAESGPFPESHVALLQTFADQAVIAIENVSLFKALEARTAELSRSVEELRALGEVGRAVSSTLNLDDVLRTIVSRVTGLAEASGGIVFEYDEPREAFHLHATDNVPSELVAALSASPIPRGEGAIGQLAVTHEPVQVVDIAGDAYHSRVRDMLLRLGYRSILAVPLLSDNRLLGGLVVNRSTVGTFAPDDVELIRTFAAQCAVAIHNARLFRELEEKSRQLEITSAHKSAFLANMSHELRTPLNAIIGFTRIVMRKTQDAIEPKQHENLEKILASSQNLLALINSILDLAKVEAGRVEVNASEVSLEGVLDHCLRTVEPLIDSSTVSLVRGYDGALPRMHVDEEKLRRIVINLLSNAAKFTTRGSVELRATAADGLVEIGVADTGIGIPQEKLGLIFEEFEQVDSTSTRVHSGTGLGLAIARRLARLMGGDIRVESTPGAGSTFTLNLPVRYSG